MAQAADSGYAPPSVASPVSFLSLLQVLFALLIVLGAIGLFAWLMRRFVPGQGGAGGLLKVVGGVMVGPKERLVVVEVGDTWLVLGRGREQRHSAAQHAQAAAGGRAATRAERRVPAPAGASAGPRALRAVAMRTPRVAGLILLLAAVAASQQVLAQAALPAVTAAPAPGAVRPSR